MTAEEREVLEERVAIAVEHLPEAEAQAVFDAIVGAMTGEEARHGDAETAHGSLLTAHTQQ